MSSRMFRDKDFSNRIKLSRLVQDLSTFGDLSSLRLWGGGRWVGGHLGAWGVSLDMCTHTYTHAHAQNAKINMLENCKWPPPWRQPCLSCLTCMHVCAHVCACACA